MMPFLITGSSKENQDLEVQKIIAPFNISSFDLTRITPENSIGIEIIRDLKQKASLKPFRGLEKAIVLEETEKLTVEAQNAFLKILEEPPDHTIIILTTKNQDLLLPTLVSRCLVIQLSAFNSPLADEELSTLNSQLSTLSKGKIGERLKLAEEVGKNREEATAWTGKMIIFLRNALLKTIKEGDNSLTLSHLDLLISFQKTHTLLSTTNVNPRLALETLFLQFRASTPRVAPPTPRVGG